MCLPTVVVSRVPLQGLVFRAAEFHPSRLSALFSADVRATEDLFAAEDSACQHEQQVTVFSVSQSLFGLIISASICLRTRTVTASTTS